MKTSHLNSIPKRQAGLSLVEIMVALVISTFLMGGVISVFIGNKATYRFADASGRIQENGRFAIDILNQDTRLSGFWGCISFQPDKDGDGDFSDDNPDIQNHLNDASGNYNEERHDFIDQPPLEGTDNDGLNNSDTITIRGGRAGQNVFTANLVQPGEGDIQVSANSSFQANDIVLITNCFTADIFEITAVSEDGTTLSHTTAAQDESPGNKNINDCAGSGVHCLMASSDAPYTPNNSAAFTLQTVRYFLADSCTGNGETSLWRSINGRDQELIEGVENFQILYGVDSDADGTPNQFLTAGAMNNAQFNQVTTLRISLVIRSDEDNIVDESQPYTLNGQTITPVDRRLRQVFSTTIALRNR